jgi:ATP-dependent RNA helicase DeaD
VRCNNEADKNERPDRPERNERRNADRRPQQRENRRKPDWRDLMPDFSEEGWARRKPKKKK